MSTVTNRVQAEWSEGVRFRVESASGERTDVDGDKKAGLSPMEMLLGSLVTCMGADVASILQKMRVDLRALTIEAVGDRNPEPPKYYRRVDLTFSVVGDVSPDQMERAIQLSREKYCGAFHSLRPDLVVEHKVVFRGS